MNNLYDMYNTYKNILFESVPDQIEQQSEDSMRADADSCFLNTEEIWLKKCKEFWKEKIQKLNDTVSKCKTLTAQMIEKWWAAYDDTVFDETLWWIEEEWYDDIVKWKFMDNPNYDVFNDFGMGNITRFKVMYNMNFITESYDRLEDINVGAAEQMLHETQEAIKIGLKSIFCGNVEFDDNDYEGTIDFGIVVEGVTINDLDRFCAILLEIDDSIYHMILNYFAYTTPLDDDMNESILLESVEDQVENTNTDDIKSDIIPIRDKFKVLMKKLYYRFSPTTSYVKELSKNGDVVEIDEKGNKKFRLKDFHFSNDFEEFIGKNIIKDSGIWIAISIFKRDDDSFDCLFVGTYDRDLKGYILKKLVQKDFNSKYDPSDTFSLYLPDVELENVYNKLSEFV